MSVSPAVYLSWSVAWFSQKLLILTMQIDFCVGEKTQTNTCFHKSCFHEYEFSSAHKPHALVILILMEEVVQRRLSISNIFINLRRVQIMSPVWLLYLTPNLAKFGADTDSTSKLEHVPFWFIVACLWFSFM